VKYLQQNICRYVAQEKKKGCAMVTILPALRPARVIEWIARACNDWEWDKPYVQNAILFTPEMAFNAIRGLLRQTLMQLSASIAHDDPFVLTPDAVAESFGSLADTMEDFDTALTFVGAAFESLRTFQVGDGALVIDDGSLSLAKYGLRVSILYWTVSWLHSYRRSPDFDPRKVDQALMFYHHAAGPQIESEAAVPARAPMQQPPNQVRSDGLLDMRAWSAGEGPSSDAVNSTTVGTDRARHAEVPMRAPAVPRRRFGSPPPAPSLALPPSEEMEGDEVEEEFDEEEHRDLLGLPRKP
jgi:hypothetical protein